MSIKKKSPYNRLIGKILLQTLGIAVAAIIVVVCIRVIGAGKIGNAITHIYCQVTGRGWESGRMWYMYNVRQYYIGILAATMLILFFIFMAIFVHGFTRYFDEIVEGINTLASEKKQMIQMSPELDFVGYKLNQVQEELERSAKEKEEAEQRKNDLVVYLAHDIKTPLTSVIGYLSFLDETKDMPEEQRAKYVHITLEKAFRLEKLINEFFEITRYNVGGVPLAKQEIDLSYMMVQMIDEAYPLLVANGKTVDNQVPEEVTIYADPEKMARAFNNILKNAITYSQEQSAIEIAAQQDQESINVYIRSRGEIPKDQLNNIFEKFYRLDEARQSATGGAGLGLAIAKDIVTLHGGKIRAYCENGKTVFEITLPK